MARKYKTGLILILTGLYLLVMSAFLTLAIRQAIRLISLFQVSGSSPPTTVVRNLQRLSLNLPNDALITAIVAVILFILVFRYPRRLFLISISATLIFITLNLFSGRHVLPQILVWPTPITLSEQYIHALASNDLETALGLTNRSDECDKIMVQVFRDHQALLKQRLGDDEPETIIQNILVEKITTFYDKPVPKGLVIMQPVPSQLATIMVEPENDGTIWLTLKMKYKPFLGTRYICGQVIGP